MAIQDLADVTITVAMRIAIAMRAWSLVCIPSLIGEALRRVGVFSPDVTPMIEHAKVVAGDSLAASQAARDDSAMLEKIVVDHVATSTAARADAVGGAIRMEQPRGTLSSPHMVVGTMIAETVANSVFNPSACAASSKAHKELQRQASSARKKSCANIDCCACDTHGTR